MKAVVFGAKGNLGQDLVAVLKAAGHEVVALDREELDILDSEAVRNRVMSEQAAAIINAAAMNDVDGAEDPAKRPFAFRLNADAPAAMAAAAKEAGAKFVHFSTDYVFDGAKPEGYAEDDEPRPLSAYGESKLAGERGVAAAGGDWYVCRTSKLFGVAGASALSKPSFVSRMLANARTKPELGIVDEEVGSPTYTKDLAEAAVRLAIGDYAPGIYHLVNEGPGVTWYGFAEEFFGLLDVTTPRKPLPASAFPRKAQVPKFAPLKNTKFPPLRPRLAALRELFREHPEMR